MPKFLSDGIFDGSSTDLIVDGKIGIGITPSAKLTVSNPSDYEIVLETGTASHGKLAIGHFSNGSMITTFGNDGGSGDLIRFGTHTGDERMRITSGGDIGINETNPSQKLHVDGGIRITGAYYDSNNSPGTSGQVLSSTATGTDWIDQGDVTAAEAEIAKTLQVTVKNVSGGELTKGTVVHASPSASPPSGNVIEVIAADYDDVAKMPAIGILKETIADEAEGEAVMMGALSGIATNGFTAGDELYVGADGALTNTKPQTAGQLIQKIAVCVKSHASNGLIKIFGAGRSNDVPLPLYIDNTNQRLGIGEPSPSDKLDVDGKILADAFRTHADTADYSVISRSNAGNPPLYVQSADSGTDQPIAKFFYGDVNPNAGSLVLNVGKDKSYFTNTNVGIGTTSPSQKLDVDGNINVGSTLGGNVYFAGTTTGPSIYGEPVGFGGRLFLKTAGSSAMTINNTGNVGIGVTNPGVKLEVVGTNAVRIHDGTDQGSIFFRGDRDDVYIKESSYQLLFGAPSGMVFELDTNNNNGDFFNVTHRGSSRFYINGETGNVGIGTPSPDAPLRIDQDSNAVALKVTGGGGGSPIAEFVRDVGADASVKIHAQSALPTISLASANNTFSLGVNNTTFQICDNDNLTANPRLSIDSSGNVGIGTTSPGSPLHVAASGLDTSAGALGVHIGVHSSTYAGIEMVSAGSNSGWIDFLNVTGGGDYKERIRGGAGHFEFHTNGSERVRIDSSGNVGIGTTNPGDKLQVEGTVRANSPGTSDWALLGYNNLNTAASGIWFDNGDGELLLRDDSNNLNVRLRSDSSSYLNGGNVGIGDTNPDAKLTVFRTDNTYAVNLSDTESRAGLSVKSSGAFDSKLTISSGASSRQYIQAVNNAATTGRDIAINPYGGNVGIGVTSPSGKLEVRQDANNGNTSAFTNPHVKLTASATADNQGFVGITAATSTANNYGYSFGAQRTSGGVGDFKINYHNNSAAGTNRFLIDQDGNVGIGTTSPSNKLDVNGNIEASKIILPTAGTSGGGTVTTPAGKLDIRSDSSWSNSAIIARTTTNANPVLAWYRPTGTGSTSYPWHFEANGSSFHIKTGSVANIGSESVSTKVTINSSGNVGIGITNLEASAALTLHRNDVDLEFSVDYAVADTARILSYDRTANTHRDLQLRGKKLTFYANSNERMRLEEDGDLHVDGDVIAYSTTISDSRLKDEVKTINSAVDKVKKLRGVEYVWNKGSKEGQKDLGVIAQEVEKVLPEIVKEKKIPLITENSDKLFKTVDYEKITAVLIEAIKEQQKQIDELKNQLNAFTK